MDALSNVQFRAISKSANDAIISIDKNGSIIFWNAAAKKLFGYSGREVAGKNIELIILEKFIKKHREGMKRVLSGGPHHVIGKTAELTGKRKDGSLFPLELSLSTWKTKDGQFFGGIIRDISVRKQYEEDLKSSELKFRSISETANDAIISADEKGLITSWNNTARKIFGYTYEEAIRKPLEIIIPEEYREPHRKGMQRVLKGGKHKVIGKTVELQGQRKDGSVFPIELSLSTWTDTKRHFCGIIRDITLRKVHEEALRKSEENLRKKAVKLREANYQIQLKNNQLKELSQKLAKYLSHQVYSSIFKGQKEVKIESYRKKLTIFFSDIQGFTELSDRVESEVLTNVLNSYLNEMSRIAHDHGGTLDKFIGDAIMIFFGDPESKGSKKDALACIRMALEMRGRLKFLHKEWESWGISRPLSVRMGINTGFCTVGNFGSEERMDYTIVGSQVNLASRLEAMADTDQILISHDTYALIKEEVACTAKEEVQVKGIAYPVQTYQVIDFYKNLKKRHKQVKKSLKGFNLLLNTKELNGQSMEKVKEALERALSLLDQK